MRIFAWHWIEFSLPLRLSESYRNIYENWKWKFQLVNDEKVKIRKIRKLKIKINERKTCFAHPKKIFFVDEKLQEEICEFFASVFVW